MSCVICNESNDPLTKVKEKGLSSLIDCSKKRNEDSIYHSLINLKKENTEVFVHENCRKWFNNKRRISTDKQERDRDTRQSTNLFNWKQNCFFCNEPCDSKNSSRRVWHFTSTLQIRQSVLNTCNSKLENNSSSALQVKKRTLDCIDYVAAEARYHRSCRLQFENQDPSADEPNAKKKKGRKVNSKQMESFDKACKWLEEDTSIHLMPEFRQKVKE